MITDGKLRAGPALETVAPPAWVAGVVGAEPGRVSGRTGVRVIDGGEWALISGTIDGAEQLGALDLQHAVCSLYLSIRRAAAGLDAKEPVRLWNFIPGIHARMGGGDGGFLDRYMMFNAGRFAAYAEWYGEGDMGPRVATATGIGHTGAELVVHCLTSRRTGRAIENPRQVPAYRYSRRRGPMPPCFARATMMEESGLLLVGGTSSVCGESSVHLGDIHEQALETFHNLACLADRSGEMSGSTRPGDSALRLALARYRTLRVYCLRAADLQVLRDLVEVYFPGLDSLELNRADVCRRTLLVEIEGTAQLRAPRGNGRG